MSSLLKVLMSAPDDATVAAKRGTAEKLMRENEAAAALGTLMSGFKPGGSVADLYGTALRGGINPQHVGDAIRGVTAVAPDVDDLMRSRAFLGAGGAWSSTPTGFAQGQATEIQKQRLANDAAMARAQFELNNKPTEIMTPEGPRIARTQDAIGQMPLAAESNVRGGFLAQNFGNVGALPPAEQRILGAESKTQPTPRNYVAGGQSFITYDGVTDARSGQPLPAGGYIANAQGTANDVGLRPNVQGDLQTRVINANSALEVGNQILGILAKDPAVVGPTGNTRRLLQDATDVFGSVATVFGGQQQLVGEIDRARQDLVQTLGPQAQTLLPELFNPNLNSIETLNGFLVYKVAEALGQSGRGASDQDIQRVIQMVGSPSSWLTGPTTYENKIRTILDLVTSSRDAAQRALSGGAGASAGAAPAGDPTVGTTPAPAGDQPRRRRYNPATGQIE
ncbi:hypothetical protein [Chelatococcus sp. GW1]|nr:hypothetical protein [Chelatococcus sp. GW1]